MTGSRLKSVAALVFPSSLMVHTSSASNSSFMYCPLLLFTAIACFYCAVVTNFWEAPHALHVSMDSSCFCLAVVISFADKFCSLPSLMGWQWTFMVDKSLLGSCHGAILHWMIGQWCLWCTFGRFIFLIVLLTRARNWFVIGTAISVPLGTIICVLLQFTICMYFLGMASYAWKILVAVRISAAAWLTSCSAKDAVSYFASTIIFSSAWNKILPFYTASCNFAVDSCILGLILCSFCNTCLATSIPYSVSAHLMLLPSDKHNCRTQFLTIVYAVWAKITFSPLCVQVDGSVHQVNSKCTVFSISLHPFLQSFFKWSISIWHHLETVGA